MNVKQRFVLFSIETKLTAHNREKPIVESRLAKYGFKKVLGSYKGILENSYLVSCKEDDALKEVLDLANEFYQESILIVDETGKATLQYLSSPANATIIGRWTSVSALDAQSLDNWTLDGTDYYSVA